MGKNLMILEVSKKQDYIFSSQKLRENAERSEDIRNVTSGAFFLDVAEDLYRNENMVYSGGGHTVLQFDDAGQATAFAARITETVLRSYDGLELFVKQSEYQADKTPGENLKQLTAELERKKSRRRDSFQRLSFGVEELDPITFKLHRELPEDRFRGWDRLLPPCGYEFPEKFEKLAGKENFISVIHIDGNAMGGRVAGIYKAAGRDWNVCCEKLQRFSEGIQQDFEDSFREMAEELIRQDHTTRDTLVLPVYPVILAGDDVCFVARGSLGLECARIFLEKLTAKSNREDRLPYSACAGVAMVHLKYPFNQAYDLAESLCESAKSFGSQKDPERRISAMDWHIEFGQLKGGLSELRDDYETEDGCRLELRPLVVVRPSGVQEDMEMRLRSYHSFCSTFRKLSERMGQGGSQNGNKIARWKVKDLRTALKQGMEETGYYLEDTSISQLSGLADLNGFSDAAKKNTFVRLNSVWRSTLFDAIEMLDHCTLLEEVRK